MTWKALIGIVTLGVCTTAAALTQAQPRGAALANEICAPCHGSKGNSLSPAFPKLAGQQKEYLVAQLKAFRDHTRGDPMAQVFMWDMASQLTDDTIAELATYFASQKPSPGKRPAASLAQEGRDIFNRGVPTANVAPCVNCHRAHAEGNGVIPRLADQHAEYVLKQLASFKTQVRDSNAKLMHTETGRMTFGQMMAVAAFVSRSQD
jgi:cytochrome c553